MKKFDIKKSLDFLFPDDSSKIIAIIVIFIVLILSFVFTFIIVKNIKNQGTFEDKIENKEVIKIELLEPNIDFVDNTHKNLNFNNIQEIDKKDFENLFKYKEFGDFTNFIFEFDFYKRQVEIFLKN